MSLTRTLRSFDDDELFWALYIIGVVAYGVHQYAKRRGREEGREHAERRQERMEELERERRRDELELGEEALCYLESGGTIDLDRWHGGELSLAAEEVVVDVTEHEDSE